MSVIFRGNDINRTIIRVDTIIMFQIARDSVMLPGIWGIIVRMIDRGCTRLEYDSIDKRNEDYQKLNDLIKEQFEELKWQVTL